MKIFSILNNFEKVHIKYFQKILSADSVLVNDLTESKYTKDESSAQAKIPFVVLKPINTKEVAEIAKYCSSQKIAISIRGGGTGLMGGAIAFKGNILLSLERLNSLLEIDSINKTATVEAGMINLELQRKLEDFDLFFPCDPGSWGTAQIGGNIATNASGPRGAQFGSCVDYIVSLEVVKADGQVFWTSPEVEKFSGGIRLTELFIGSEGQLGIITKAKLKLVDKPKNEALFLLAFNRVEDSFIMVNKLRSNLFVRILEFMEKDAIDMVFSKSSATEFSNISSAYYLFLVISKDELNKALSFFETENLSENDIYLADNPSEIDRLMQLRKLAPVIAKERGFLWEHDCVVKAQNLNEFYAEVKKMTSNYEFPSLLYGHAANGNLHLRLKKSDKISEEGYQEFVNQLFMLIKKLGGHISGEHGIGSLQKDLLPIFFDENQLKIQKGIKQLFDPNGILNPHKVFNL